jgi:hypothetical protein
MVTSLIDKERPRSWVRFGIQITAASTSKCSMAETASGMAVTRSAGGGAPVLEMREECR